MVYAPQVRRLICSFVLGMIVLLGVAAAEPPTTHEIVYTRPSGFWTSTRPAVGGAYRWRLLYVGIGLASLTGLGMWRLVRRANAQRAAANR